MSTLATPFLCHVSFCVHGGSTRVTRFGFAACRQRVLNPADASKRAQYGAIKPCSTCGQKRNEKEESKRKEEEERKRKAEEERKRKKDEERKREEEAERKRKEEEERKRKEDKERKRKAEEEKRKAEEEERLRLAFPKVVGLKLPESIEAIARELGQLGVSEESELVYLEDEDFKKLPLKPVSRGRIKELASKLRESPAAVVQAVHPEQHDSAALANQAPAALPRPKRWGDGLEAPAAGKRNFLPQGFVVAHDVRGAIERCGHSSAHVAGIMEAGRTKASTATTALSVDHASALYAYTEESPLYSTLNYTMRTPHTPSTPTDTQLKQFADYIVHTEGALGCLPTHVSEVYGYQYRDYQPSPPAFIFTISVKPD